MTYHQIIEYDLMSFYFTLQPDMSESLDNIQGLHKHITSCSSFAFISCL